MTTGERLSFNPLFGTGGNAGRRNFAEGWAKATSMLKTPAKKWKRPTLNADLAAFLQGQPGLALSDYKAGCWFGADNKAYNSGTAKPSRKGQISPWAMALACEAFGLSKAVHRGGWEAHGGQRARFLLSRAARPHGAGRSGQESR